MIYFLKFFIGITSPRMFLPPLYRNRMCFFLPFLFFFSPSFPLLFFYVV
jgi:hypothetical protein